MTKLVLIFALLTCICSYSQDAPDSIIISDSINICLTGPGKTIRQSPAIAYGDSVYMVVWQEGWHGKNGKSRITAARVHTKRGLIDSTGIIISPCSTGTQEKPRIAFSNGIFLVAWHDMRNGSDCNIYAARITSNGTILDTTPIPLAVMPRTQVLPDVAGFPKGFMVVWQGFSGQSTTTRLFGAIVDSAGLVTSTPLNINKSNPRIAWNENSFVLTCKAANRTNQYVRLDTIGNTISTPVDIYGGGSSEAVVKNGRGWAIVMHREDPDYWGWGGPGAIMAYYITSAGNLTTSTAQPCYQCTPTRYANWLDYGIFNTAGQPWPWGKCAVAWDGTHVVAVWTRYRLGGGTGIDFVRGSIITGRLERDIPVEPKGVFVSRPTGEDCLINPVIASNNNHQLLCVFEKTVSGGGTHIVAKFIYTSNDSGISTERAHANIGYDDIALAPNPFNGSVQIVVSSIQIDYMKTYPSVAIYSVNGKRITTLKAATRKGNQLEYTWNPTKEPSGVYVVKVFAGKNVISRKLTMVR